MPSWCAEGGELETSAGGCSLTSWFAGGRKFSLVGRLTVHPLVLVLTLPTPTAGRVFVVTPNQRLLGNERNGDLEPCFQVAKQV